MPSFEKCRDIVTDAVRRSCPKYAILFDGLFWHVVSHYARIESLRINPAVHHVRVFQHSLEIVNAIGDAPEGLIKTIGTLALVHDLSPELKVTTQDNKTNDSTAVVKQKGSRFLHVYEGAFLAVRTMLDVNRALADSTLAYTDDEIHEIGAAVAHHDDLSLKRPPPSEDKLLQYFIDADSLWMISYPEEKTTPEGPAADIWRNHGDANDPKQLRTQLDANLKNLAGRQRVRRPPGRSDRFVFEPLARPIFDRYVDRWSNHFGITPAELLATIT